MDEADGWGDDEAHDNIPVVPVCIIGIGAEKPKRRQVRIYETECYVNEPLRVKETKDRVMEMFESGEIPALMFKGQLSYFVVGSYKNPSKTLEIVAIDCCATGGGEVALSGHIATWSGTTKEWIEDVP